MRILRLTNSNDLGAHLPTGNRAPDVMRVLLTELLGQPIEIVQHHAWPSRTLPGVVERWLDTHDPDVVMLTVNPFAFNYESVPLRLRRKLGIFGAPFATLGYAAGAHPAIGPSRFARRARRVMRRVIGGDTYLEPPEVIEAITGAITRTASREGIAMIVSGPTSNQVGEDSIDPVRGEARRAQVETAIREAAARARVHYFGTGANPLPASERERFRHTDGFHSNLMTHALLGLGAAQMVACALEDQEPRGLSIPRVRALFDTLRHTEGSPIFNILSDAEAALIPRLQSRVTFISPVQGELTLG